MTDASYNPPSINPEEEGSLAGAFRAIIGKALQNLDDCLPCEVLAYDGRLNRVSVRPCVALVTTDGTTVERAPVASIPVLRIGAGGGMLSFPIKPGDLGWMKATDRDLSLFAQSLSSGAPNTKRMHSFQDAFFIPDAMRRAAPEGEDADRIVLSWDDGSRVVVGAGTVEVHGVATVKVVAPTVRIEGNVDCTGSAKFAGGVEGAGGVKLETHKHGLVQPGSGQSGGPVP